VDPQLWLGLHPDYAEIRSWPPSRWTAADRRLAGRGVASQDAPIRLRHPHDQT